MGQAQSAGRVGYTSVQASQHSDTSTIISTLSPTRQECLISGTVCASEEVNIMNDLLKTGKTNSILVYGENCSDDTPDKKRKQLNTLGFTRVQVYGGGLFEWLLLQDVYGKQNFPTTCDEIDMLKYGPKSGHSSAIVNISNDFT